MMVNGSMTREWSKCRSTSSDWFYKCRAKNKFLTCSFAHSSTGLEDHWWGCFLSPLVSGWWLEAALIFCCCGLTWWALRNCGGMIPVSVGSEKPKKYFMITDPDKDFEHQNAKFSNITNWALSLKWFALPGHGDAHRSDVLVVMKCRTVRNMARAAGVDNGWPVLGMMIMHQVIRGKGRSVNIHICSCFGGGRW